MILFTCKYHFVTSACCKIIINIVSQLCEVFSHSQGSRTQFSLMRLGRTHNKVTRYLYSIRFICHIQYSSTVIIAYSFVFGSFLCLYAIISVDDKLTAVYLYFSAGLYEIPVDCKGMSVEVQFAHSKYILSVNNFILRQGFSYRTAVGKRYFTATLVHKLRIVERVFDFYSVFACIVKCYLVKRYIRISYIYDLFFCSVKYDFAI